jgi:hypothetical protein
MSLLRSGIQQLKHKVQDLTGDLEALEALLEVDIPSSLNKIRFITEKVLQALCKSKGVSWGQAEPTLERMIGPLVAANCVPKSIAVHVRTIQMNTSPGSHYQESALSQSHVAIAQNALLEFLEWYCRESAGCTGHSGPQKPAARSRGPSPRMLWVMTTVALCVACAGLGLGVFLLSRPAENPREQHQVENGPPDAERTDEVPNQPPAAAALKAEVEKIAGGRSRVTEVKVGDKVLKVGDTAPVKAWEWVDVMNLIPVESRNARFVFKEDGDFDRCGVDEGGTIKILGFTDDKTRALVEYTLPKGTKAAGTKAPSGVQYFILVSKFAQMKR